MGDIAADAQATDPPATFCAHSALMSAHDYAAGAFRRESFGQCPPDPARAPGHHDTLAGDLQCPPPRLSPPG